MGLFRHASPPPPTLAAISPSRVIVFRSLVSTAANRLLSYPDIFILNKVSFHTSRPRFRNDYRPEAKIHLIDIFEHLLMLTTILTKIRGFTYPANSQTKPTLYVSKLRSAFPDESYCRAGPLFGDILPACEAYTLTMI
jgi:hypothetical protein